MTTKKTESETLELREVTINLVWGNPEGIQTIYANNLYITHAGSEFYLVFGELQPLLQVDKDKFPSHLEIRPVAKIAISQENMMKFADAITENTNRFKKKMELLEMGKDGDSNSK